MKFNTLFVAAICAGTLLSSCVNKTAQERQLAYTQATLIDTDGYNAIQIIGETAITGIQHAERANDQDVAGKVKSFYDQLLPELEKLATSMQMDFPIKGIPALDDATEDSTDLELDSAEVVETVSTSPEVNYVEQAQHEIATIKEQLGRMTRNTNKEVQDFAKAQLSTANDVFTAIGGKEEAHAHH